TGRRARARQRSRGRDGDAGRCRSRARPSRASKPRAPETRVKPFLGLRTTEEAWDELDSSRPLGTEVVPARSALGRVLAKPVTAREDVPHFFRSNMDGFAVRAADTTGASDES